MLAAIWAQDLNRAIGRRGDVPWHVPEDLRLFKTLTMGHAVIMGRSTWETLPKQPLGGRENYVLTRQQGFEAPGAHVVHDLDEIRERFSGDELAWIMGGEQIYRALFDDTDAFVVTEVGTEADEPDAFAPKLPAWPVAWELPEGGWRASTSGLRYRVRVSVRPGLTVFDTNPLAGLEAAPGAEEL